MKQELLKDVAGSVSFTPYINNQPGIASAATVTIKKTTGESVVSAVSASVDGTTGEISYGLSAAQIDELGENWSAKWAYTISSVAYNQTTLFDVVLHKLAITVIDTDLLDEQSDLLTKNENFSGAVDSATTTTIIDTDLKEYDDDYYNGGILVVINPTNGVKQTREITDFASSTGTITVGTAFGTTPDSTYHYIAYRGFEAKIDKAFEEMMLEVRQRGFRPALILESSELHIPHVKKTLEMICIDYMKEDGDKWDKLATKYGKEYQNYISKVVFQYDRDEDGLITGTDTDNTLGSIRMVR